MQVQLTINNTLYKEFQKLRIDTGLSTDAEVLNNALAIFDWAVKERKRGRSIASVDEINMKFKELWTPALEYVKK